MSTRRFVIPISIYSTRRQIPRRGATSRSAHPADPQPSAELRCYAITGREVRAVCEQRMVDVSDVDRRAGGLTFVVVAGEQGEH